MTTAPAPRHQTHGQWLRAQRHARNWTIPDLRRHLRHAAAQTGDTLPGNEILGLLIRRWEDGNTRIPERYRNHYCRALGIPNDQYGTSPPPGTTSHPRTTTELTRLRHHARDTEPQHRPLTLILILTIETCEHAPATPGTPPPDPGHHTPDGQDR